MKTPSKILITGGAGFIGSHLVESLLAKGNEVICIDNFLTGKKENIEEFLGRKNFRLFKYDIIQPLKKEIRQKIHGITRLYHLASPASPPQYKKYAIETLLVNSIGTYNMLEVAKEERAKFLLASTSEVYGNPLVHPQKEGYFGNVNPIGVRSCYDEGKRFAESITMNYHRKYQVDTRIIRIFNTYGPKMDREDGRVIANFINQALRDIPLTMHGDGTQTRSFCYVSDMVDGLSRAMESKGANSEVINLGYPKEYTISEIGKIIVDLTKSSSEIKRYPPQEDDPERRKPDITKAKKLLGWDPSVSLTIGLSHTINYFRSL
ncbi:SDR family oxidoreductase [Candidatus Gottesmanbacteria bacterium]|nr:SDR family oxidoreductase [Candidatus Gottesmanbacteria bacterium]